MTTRTSIETHPVSTYVRDDRVNRLLSPARVAKLRANLDVDDIGVFIVSQRPNGDLVILDGGHRATALIEEGLENHPVPATVYHGLTEEEEAQKFLRYNDRLAVDIVERFRLEVVAGNIESIQIDKAIRGVGFSPQKNSSSDKALQCIGAVQAVYRGGTNNGREAHLSAVKDTLEVIKQSWGTSKTASKETVRGIGGLFLNNPDLDKERLINGLAALRGGPNAIKARASYHIREGGQSARHGAELAVAEIYNKGLAKAQQVAV